MSDFSHGDGWWRASDGLWYSPEAHPDYVPREPSAGGAYKNPGRPEPKRLRPPQGESELRPDPVPSLEPTVTATWYGIVTYMARAVVLTVVVISSAVLLWQKFGPSDEPTTTVTENEEPPVLVAADISVARTAAEPQGGVYIGTGMMTESGFLAFGTFDRSLSAEMEIWDETVLASGPRPVARVSSVSVPSGAPYFEGVTQTADGFIAGGGVILESGLSLAAVFSSTDGFQWTLVGALGNVGDATQVRDIAAVDGILLAVGARDIEQHALYRSNDGGVSWQLADQVGLIGHKLWGLGSYNGTFYAVGETVDAAGTPLPTVHSSQDGVQWTEKEFVFDGEYVTGFLLDVAPMPGGLVAVGGQPGEAAGDVLVMVSIDGEVWERILSTPKSSSFDWLRSVSPTDSGAIATGSVDDKPAFWEITIGE